MDLEGKIAICQTNVNIYKQITSTQFFEWLLLAQSLKYDIAHIYTSNGVKEETVKILRSLEDTNI